jgi:hypothetical protein
MSIVFKCDCGTQFVAKVEYAGRKAICPACRRELAVSLPTQTSIAPSPASRGQRENVSAEQPGTVGYQEGGARPFSKVPILVILGRAITGVVLISFFAYLCVDYSTKAFRPNPFDLKAEADKLASSGKTRQALERYEQLLTMIRERRIDNGDAETLVAGANAARDRLAAAITRAPELDLALGTGRPIGVMRNPKIPVDVSYPVVDEYREPPVKRSLTVRLNVKVSEDVLRAMALELKGMETAKYEYTYISYFLPGMSWDLPVWAVSNFAPALQVDIRGLTIEQEELLVRLPVSLPDGVELIGSWISDEADARHRLTILRKESRYYVVSVSPPAAKRAMGRGSRRENLTSTKYYTDLGLKGFTGPGIVHELSQCPGRSNPDSDRRVNDPGGLGSTSSEGPVLDLELSEGDDHYRITESGDLEIRHLDVLVSRARRIEPPNRKEPPGAIDDVGRNSP